MRAQHVAVLVAVAVLVFPRPVPAQLAGPIQAGRVKAGTLSFDGHATAGDFIGTTSKVSGEMTGADDLSGVRGWVEAPVKTLATGDRKRDKDLNKSMESDKYPTIRFDLAGVAPESGAGDSTAVKLEGKMTIHGVTRDVTLPAHVRRQGGELRLRTDFPLNLKDYKIGGLSKLLGMLKMYEDIEVHVDLIFAPP